jgi:hypothetical protein
MFIDPVPTYGCSLPHPTRYDVHLQAFSVDESSKSSFHFEDYCPKDDREESNISKYVITKTDAETPVRAPVIRTTGRALVGLTRRYVLCFRSRTLESLWSSGPGEPGSSLSTSSAPRRSP